MGPNELDNPDEDQELKIGDTVYWIEEGQVASTTPLKIIAIGSSRTSFDYCVETPTGNKFYVKADEIIER